MKKDYQIWMPVKTEINNTDLRPKGCKPREVWICNVGENIGFEEDGKGKEFTRPVLVLKSFNKYFCYIVPLSTTNKRGKYYHAFDGKTGKTSIALLSQSKPIDTARLSRKVGFVNKNEFKIIQEKLKEILF